MRPWVSPGESNEPGGADPLRIDAAVVGTDIRGDKIKGAPKGVAGVRRGVAKPGIAGDNNRCVSAAAATATRLHSSSHTAIYKKRLLKNS